jgi:transposase
MEINAAQFARIEEFLPRQRGNVSHENLAVINAILICGGERLQMAALPKRFGNWHTIYTRMNRWAKAGVLERVRKPACARSCASLRSTI